MLNILRPDLFLRSVYDLDWELLAKRGIRGLIVDLDNTLVGYNRPHASEKLVHWMANARDQGFRLCIVSNNLSGRVEEFARQVGVPGVPKAAKPRRRGFRRAMALMRTKASDTAVIGDQVFTDILGGNRLGLYTILVHPLEDREFFTTRLVRRIEHMVVKRPERTGVRDRPRPAHHR